MSGGWIPLLVILSWQIVLTGNADGLPEHTPHVEYPAASPHSPVVRFIPTNGFLHIGNPIEARQCVSFYGTCQ